MMELIYLASPFTHKDEWIEWQRWNIVCKVAAKMFRSGAMLHSPIAHTAPIARHGLPNGYEFWQEYDHELIRRFDKVVVLMIDGWEDSVGVQDEVAFAESIGKPIEYMEVPDDI